MPSHTPKERERNKLKRGAKQLLGKVSKVAKVVKKAVRKKKAVKKK